MKETLCAEAESECVFSDNAYLRHTGVSQHSSAMSQSHKHVNVHCIFAFGGFCDGHHTADQIETYGIHSDRYNVALVVGG